MSEVYALVTGGSSGIGLEIAKLLAQRNYNLLLVGNDSRQLSEALHWFNQNHNLNTQIFEIDLAQTDAAQKVFDFCNANNMEVEVLVNNAGFFFFGEVAEANAEKATAMMQLHMITSSLLCMLFGRQMKQRRKGYILNNASISAFKAFPGIAFYGSTKAYIKSFTLSLRSELKLYGIHVCCLCPGATATNLYDPNVIDVELGKKIGIMMSAQSVAKAGVNGLLGNKAIVVPGVMTKIMLWLSLLTPQWLIYQIRKRTKWLT